MRRETARNLVKWQAANQVGVPNLYSHKYHLYHSRCTSSIGSRSQAINTSKILSYCESSVGDQHYVCVVNPERVRGFPVEINLEEGENDADENVFDDDLDSGAVPTTPSKSDQGSDREPGSKRPREVADERMAPGPNDPDEPDDLGGEDSDDPNQRNIPELEGNLLYQHECKGHWPYDKGCDACVQARGRTPARRRKQKSEESGQTAEFQLAADYTFIAGRHWRLLVMLMIHTGMLVRSRISPMSLTGHFFQKMDLAENVSTIGSTVSLVTPELVILALTP